MKKFLVLALTLTSFMFGGSAVLIRHGEGTHNVEGIWSREAPLTEKGFEQAKTCAEQLMSEGFSSENIAAVYVSPMERTMQTASVLVEAGLVSEDQIVVEERLTETNVGDFEGKKMCPLNGIDPWDLPFAEEAGGETLADLKERVQSFLFDLREKEEEKIVLIISHGGPLRELLGVLGLEREKLETATPKVVQL